MQAAAMQLVLQKGIDGKEISPHCRLFSHLTAGRTRPVSSIIEPLKGRGRIFPWRLMIVIGGNGRLNGMPPELVAFSKLRPNLLLILSLLPT